MGMDDFNSAPAPAQDEPATSQPEQISFEEELKMRSDGCLKGFDLDSFNSGDEVEAEVINKVREALSPDKLKQIAGEANSPEPSEVVLFTVDGNINTAESHKKWETAYGVLNTLLEKPFPRQVRFEKRVQIDADGTNKLILRYPNALRDSLAPLR